MKKTNLLILAVFFIASLLMSCGQKGGSSDNAGSPKEKLDGKWKIVNATGEYADMNKGTTYTFEGVTKFSTKLGIIESKGNIAAISDSSFTVKFEGMQNDFNYTYRFDGNNLIIELLNSGQVFTLEKQ